MKDTAPLSFIITFAVVIFGAVLFNWIRKKQLAAPLPPGPRGFPLIGNLTDIPQSQPWQGFAKLGQQYGGIVHLNVLGQSIMVVNDAKHAVDMLDKKSRLYSNRPTMVMAGQLVGWDQGPALMNPCHNWNEQRRHFAQFMGTRIKVDIFNDVFHEETIELLKNLRDSPAEWFAHTRSFAAAIVLLIAYGYKSQGKDDKLVKLVDDAIDQFSEITATNAFMVDTFPILRYVPTWLPGAGFKVKAQKYRKTLRNMLDHPYEWVQAQMAAGTARPSFLSTFLDGRESQVSPSEENILKWVAGGIYSGGADTTVAGIECFYLAMVSHQDVQRKAQEEMDIVLGKGVLPTLADRARLPYVEGVFLEVMRSYAFVPVGIPHVAAEDDIHNGYFIPKNSIIITNVWQFFRDPDTYKGPEIFSPERFIGQAPEKDPRDYLFGFGRRKCPGNHFADASMWLVCASVLAAFDMQPPVKDGKTLLPSGRHLDGTISHPEPFEVDFVPRVEVMRALSA